MEKNLSTENKSLKQEFLTLDNRKNIKISGIKEVLSTSDTSLILKLSDTIMNISGDKISINKLDVDLGILEADGNINSIKYGKSDNIFKRLFK